MTSSTDTTHAALHQVAIATRSSRENFTSNTAHANFARDLASELAWSIPGFDAAEFVMLCMPLAWVGTSKSGVWERTAEMWFAKNT